jgi:hypothetical protein
MPPAANAATRTAETAMASILKAGLLAVSLFGIENEDTLCVLNGNAESYFTLFCTSRLDPGD